MKFRLFNGPSLVECVTQSLGVKGVPSINVSFFFSFQLSALLQTLKASALCDCHGDST